MSKKKIKSKVISKSKPKKSPAAKKPVKKSAPVAKKKVAAKPAPKKKAVAAKVIKKETKKVVAKKAEPKKAVKVVAKNTPVKPVKQLVKTPPPAKTPEKKEDLPKANTSQNRPSVARPIPVNRRPEPARAIIRDSKPPEETGKNRYADTELEEFRAIINKKLEEARKELTSLQAQMTAANEHGTDDTASTFKILEDGSDSLAKEEAGQLASRQKKFIEQLENALVRIENKTYGICRVTGKLIPKERLRAVPHTTQSIEAKLNQYRD
jgi:RNA polymerase-binding transcription factor DksA